MDADSPSVYKHGLIKLNLSQSSLIMDDSFNQQVLINAHYGYVLLEAVVCT